MLTALHVLAECAETRCTEFLVQARWSLKSLNKCNFESYKKGTVIHNVICRFGHGQVVRHLRSGFPGGRSQLCYAGDHISSCHHLRLGKTYVTITFLPSIPASLEESAKRYQEGVPRNGYLPDQRLCASRPSEGWLQA